MAGMAQVKDSHAGAFTSPTTRFDLKRLPAARGVHPQARQHVRRTAEEPMLRDIKADSQVCVREVLSSVLSMQSYFLARWSLRPS